MLVRANLRAFWRLHFLASLAVRTGVYTGLALALIFTVWLVLANGVPALERFALERNLVAAISMAVVALVPILRFWRFPGNLLASSLLAWTILSASYRLLCIRYHLLAERSSAIQIFMLGAVVYLIVVTVAWIGSCISRLRAGDASHSHSHHHLG